MARFGIGPIIAALAVLSFVANDGRSQDATVAVRIIGINDLHGHLEPGDNSIEVIHPDERRAVPLRSGGVAYLATLIARLRAEQPRSVVVSSGDMIGASPLVSGLFHDEPTIEVMNAIGLDANAAGNHEFDRGIDELKRIAHGGCAPNGRDHRKSCEGRTYDGARFPFLAANVIDRASEQPVLAPTVIKVFDGVRIGFIGVVTRSTPGIIIPSGVAGLRFLPEARVLNEQAKNLQTAGVQAIVALVHEGGDADGGFNSCINPRGAIFDIERQLDPAIDVVMSAHTHRGYNCRVGSRTVIQGASFGRLVSVVDVVIDRASGDIAAAATRARNIPVPNGLERDARLAAAFPPLAPDPGVAAIVQRYRSAAASVADQRIGRISAPFERRSERGGDHALGRLIADAQLAATRGSGARIAFTNPGGIRTALRTSAADGVVTYADAYAVQPFGNSLVTMTLTGDELRALLEQQWSPGGDRVRFLQPSAGFTYTWNARRPRGQKIETMLLEGRTVASTDAIRVTVNSFLAAGGDGFHALREGRDRVGGPLDIDALVAYLRTQSIASPLAPDGTSRIRRID